jgi:hypothetical protein
VYELCTSGGFSGLFWHFRPLKALQFTDSAWVGIIVVRIYAGEPPFRFNNLEVLRRLFVQILYADIKADDHNLLSLHRRSDEHGFEKCKSMLTRGYLSLLSCC